MEKCFMFVNLLDHSLKKVYTDRLLIISSVDSFAISLNHAALSNTSIPNLESNILRYWNAMMSTS